MGDTLPSLHEALSPVIARSASNEAIPGDGVVIARSASDEAIPGDGVVIARSASDEAIPGDGDVITRSASDEAIPGYGDVIARSASDEAIPGYGDVIAMSASNEAIPGDSDVIARSASDEAISWEVERRWLRGVYPEPYVEILPLHFVQGQNDRRRRARNDRNNSARQCVTNDLKNYSLVGAHKRGDRVFNIMRESGKYKTLALELRS